MFTNLFKNLKNNYILIPKTLKALTENMIKTEKEGGGDKVKIIDRNAPKISF